MINQVIQFFGLFLLMLVTGVFWGPLFSLHRTLHVFDKKEFMLIVKTIAGNLEVPMRIMMPLCIFIMAISVYIYPIKDSIGFYLSLTSLLLIVISLIITIVVEVPIVKKIQQWSVETMPENWEAIRNRWVKFHVIRTCMSLASFACFSSSILFLQ
jgi:uncharacterized membrane protein